MSRESLDDLLLEAFHTYQVYLQCTMILEDPKAKLPLLKWPDIAQSALGYARSLENANPDEIKTAKSIVRSDLIMAVAAPIEVIYKSTHERVTKILGKKPNVVPLSHEGRYKFPIHYKNDIITAINNMFKTLETMSGVSYPELRKRKQDGSAS